MTPDWDALARDLSAKATGRVHRAASLAPLTTYRVGGRAAILVEAESDGDLALVAEAAQGVPVAVVGRGSNLLVSDDGVHGVVVRLGAAYATHEAREGGVVLGGAMFLPGAARATARLGLTGFEFAAEIPGSVGGAVRMNAGAHGREMADVLVRADVFDLRAGESATWSVSDLGYAYRHSDLPEAGVVLRCELALEPEDPAAVAARIADHLRWRRENQPGGLNAGSVFKNPPGDAAGRLIDATGLKGLRVGGARVSEVHANFVVAFQDATAADVWALVGEVRRRVARETGVVLEPEIRLLGAFEPLQHEVEREG